MCLLNKNVTIDQKGAHWPKKCLPKGVYWKVMTLHIGYTKRCLLANTMPIDKKCVYWMKRCPAKGVYWKVITIHIGYNKDVYWPKMCLSTKDVPIEWKCVYLLKMCLLKNEKSQLFGIFKCIRGINLYNHVAQ